jgi:hypothetical protein
MIPGLTKDEHSKGDTIAGSFTKLRNGVSEMRVSIWIVFLWWDLRLPRFGLSSGCVENRADVDKHRRLM